MLSLDIAATGMQAQQTNVDVISNNLANSNTNAYKYQRADFQDLLYQTLRRVGSNSSNNSTIVPVGVHLGLGVKTAAIGRNTAQGPLQNTSNTLDIAIQGKGYFQITLPDGSTAYTRDGSFKPSADGIIVTIDGNPLQPSITIPQNSTSVSINQSGEVSVTVQGQTTPQTLGLIQTASFINPAGLEAIGGNLLLETAATGAPILGTPGTDGNGTLLQGFLEGSNVNPVTELTNLIKAQRVYEMNSKIISKSDEMLSNLNQSV